MGCVCSKPLPPAVIVSSAQNTVQEAEKYSEDDGKPPSEALLKMAMEAIETEQIDKPNEVRIEQDRPGSGSAEMNGSPLKSIIQQSILGDQQAEDTEALPDVSYSMRGQAVVQNPVDTLDQVNRKAAGVQLNAGGVQMPVLVPLQQPQVARGPNWVSGPPPRGRGAPIPAGYRAPGAQIPRGSLPAARGRGQPVHMMVPGDRSMTNGGQRQPFPVVENPSSPEKNNPTLKLESDSSDSDEDIGKDDEEVEDWGLDDESSVPVIPIVSPAKADPVQVQPSIESPPRRSSFQPKFRPALDLDDDFGEKVLSDNDSDSSDSNDECDDCVHDWLDAGDPPLSPPKRVVSPLKPVTPLTSAREGPSPTPKSRQMYGLTIIPPSSSSPTHINSTSTTPLPPGRPPPSYRQGNMSPTRSAGANHAPVGTSPIKQSSYRSGIVNNLSPAVVPLVMMGDQSPVKSAPSPNSAAAIRDTKVVKKKKAELPQHNLPHPVPKFGDWLNSRTMINNYIILETLGTGGYAEVKLCKEKESGKLFAMKFISRDVMKKDKLGKQSKLDDIKREIAIMKKLHHPNVLRLYEVMDDPKMNKLFLVLEYMKHGDMLSFQKKKHPQGMLENLRDRDLHSVFLQVILGLAYLHEQKIVHGDIKPQNLLVGEKDVVKIADFGISQSLYGSKQKIADVAGTPAFMSPEMCSGEEYSGQLADVWALGATIFMLKFGNPPFLAKSAMQMFERIQNDPLVFPSAIDPLLAHLLNGMLTKSPQKRLTLLDVMVHPWVTKNEKHSAALDAVNRPSRAITVSKDEIEHAVGTNHIAIIVNIRKQMRKRLKHARESLAGKKAGTDWDHSNLVFAQSPKAVNARNSVKMNKVFAVTGDSERVLSSEEIDYRSQLFSRKKASKNALEASSSSVDLLKGSAVTQAQRMINDSLEDEEVLSDDDDELAVAQSPQLLDELLLTTLSMPPLRKKSDDSGSLPLFTTKNGSKCSLSGTTSFENKNALGSTHFYGESSVLGLKFVVSSLEGRRNTQEDRWVVFPSISAAMDTEFDPWALETAYVGIYDGHGGEECANILHEQLHSWIFKSPEAPSLTAKDLQDCFEALDASVCDYLLHKDDLSGSTATGIVLRPANGKILLTIAHVGDCRLVLSKRDGDTVELTQDHRLTLDAERERVIQLGGRVVNNRVNGVMAITRAFGDLEFKGMYGTITSSGFGRGFRDNEKVPALLTAKPDVSDIELDPKEDAFLLLACDGLWDVFTNEEATAIFRERVDLHGDLQLAAHELAQEGIRRYSNDNITVIAIALHDPD
ncbi:Serine/threonine-protein kinase GRIK2 [Phytophthora citrophthora]|uniref:Serine/threonine-protein kinase GRIK2 n=1 Tax=Phytophthora citrophthora TaxID=4793 RepID=A0AAD9GMX6_9STRA|nr:Serine/threonine-protein kinase GRIK2 [Phytophthora citrophthora]